MFSLNEFLAALEGGGSTVPQDIRRPVAGLSVQSGLSDIPGSVAQLLRQLVHYILHIVVYTLLSREK